MLFCVTLTRSITTTTTSLSRTSSTESLARTQPSQRSAVVAASKGAASGSLDDSGERHRVGRAPAQGKLSVSRVRVGHFLSEYFKKDAEISDITARLRALQSYFDE